MISHNIRYYIIITYIYWCGKKKKLSKWIYRMHYSVLFNFLWTFAYQLSTRNRYNYTKLCCTRVVQKGKTSTISLNQKCNIIFSNRASKREHLREAGQLYKLGKSRLLIGAAENSGNNAIFIYYLNNRGAYTLEGATRGRYVPLVMGSSESRVRFEQIHIDKIQIRIFPFRNLK